MWYVIISSSWGPLFTLHFSQKNNRSIIRIYGKIMVEKFKFFNLPIF